MRNLNPPPTDNNEPDRLIGTTRKNSRDDIAVSLRTYKGYRFVDLRVMSRRPDGELLPTSKGVTIRPDALPELIEILRKAHAEAVAAGWCSGESA